MMEDKGPASVGEKASFEHGQTDVNGVRGHESNEKVDPPMSMQREKEDAEWDGASVDFSHIDRKKVLRKMDIRLIPNLALLYLLSFLDRGNIGNAKIEGLTEDLKMTGPQYNLCLTVFFFTYCGYLPRGPYLLRSRREKKKKTFL